MKLKGHDCEKMVKMIGNQISLTLPTIDTEGAELNMELFTDNIVELITASNIPLN
jgi:hypothetical protein